VASSCFLSGADETSSLLWIAVIMALCHYKPTSGGAHTYALAGERAGPQLFQQPIRVSGRTARHSMGAIHSALDGGY